MSLLREMGRMKKRLEVAEKLEEVDVIINGGLKSGTGGEDVLFCWDGMERIGPAN